MITYRLAKEDDRLAWDAVVHRLARNGTYSTLFVWKSVVCENFGHEGVFLIAEKDGQIVGILPGFLSNTLPPRLCQRFPILTRRFRRWIGHEGLAWDYNGPWAEGNDEEIIDGLICCLEKHAKRSGAVDAVIMAYMGNRLLEELAGRILEKRGWSKCGYSLSQTFDLTQSEEDLRGQMAKTHRKSLDKFVGAEFEFVEESSEDSAALVYLCLDETRRRARSKRGESFPVPTIAFFKDLLHRDGGFLARVFAVKKDAVTYGVHLDTYLGTLVCVKWGGCARLLQGSSLDLGCVYADWIRHKRKGFTLYDHCWLPPDRAGPLYEFKARFRGDVRVIPHYRKVLSKPKHIVLKTASAALRTFQRIRTL